MILEWTNPRGQFLAGAEGIAWRPRALVEPEVLFLNWLAAGGGAPVWWHEIPTPAYARLTPRTPAEHLRPRRRRRRRREVAVMVVAGQLVTEPPRLAEALRRLYRRRTALPPPVPSRVDLRESDEEFLILTGRL